MHSCQVSGYEPSGKPILSVLTKRTYVLGPNGRPELAEEQLPLTEQPEADPDIPEILVQDMDLYPFKPLTDVVLKGHAYGNGASRMLDASVRVERHVKKILVVGERRVWAGHMGRVLFSEPGLIERVPLCYTHAYGGRDAVAEAKYGNPAMAALGTTLSPDECDLRMASPFVYPRNPVGQGYLTEAWPDSLEQLVLPNLEDPEDRLSGERLVAGGSDRWPDMPLPQATDWLSHTWFPRLSYLGVVPVYAPSLGTSAEVRRGFAPAGVMQPHTPTAMDSFLWVQGASLGLQLTHLRGGEECELTNIHPRWPTFRFHLPGERPRIWTDGRKGKLSETDPVIHTLVLEPDKDRFTILWRGSADALRPYLPQELEKMPFRVEWP